MSIVNRLNYWFNMGVSKNKKVVFVMAHFFSSYWWMFSGVFFTAGSLITLNLVKVILFKKELSLKLKVVDLILSFGIVVLLISANLFSGVLYDQFNLTTDNTLLIVTFYSGVLFLIQTFYTFRKTKKSPING